MPTLSAVAAAQPPHPPLPATALFLALAALYVLVAGTFTVLFGTLRLRWPGRIVKQIPLLDNSIERRAQQRTDKALRDMDAAEIAPARRPTPIHLTDIHKRRYFGAVGSFAIWAPAVLLTLVAYTSAPPTSGRSHTGVELMTLALVAAIGTFLVADQFMAARSAPHDQAVISALAVLATLTREPGQRSRSPYQRTTADMMTDQIERLCGSVAAVARTTVSTRDVEFRRTMDAEANRLISALHARKRRMVLSGTASDRRRLANLIGSFASQCALPASDVVVFRLVDPRLLDGGAGSALDNGPKDRLRVIIPAWSAVAALELATWATAHLLQAPAEMWGLASTAVAGACGLALKRAGVPLPWQLDKRQEPDSEISDSQTKTI